ncbi:sugar phosphate isomerase/epimerase family protein [Mongoliimonas terrestris]|uniref:sugar phosphate isomerase/epimerase family protein n=1 Tax=Mongoliimonas terrestris TaxID=1709001 RepID=UPI000B1A0E9B|nr:sugar phosphate isomerase/epimerase [Mongoliimonas terrestris]
MTSRPFPVSTALFDGHPMALAIDEIARAGATHVEPAFIHGYVDFDETAFADPAADTLARRVCDAGLAVAGVSAHIDLGEPDAGALLARRIRFASRLGARVLITNGGRTDRQGAVLATIADALPALQAAGVVLALENPGHGSGALIGCGRDGAALVAEIGDPLVRMNLDVGNAVTYAGGRLDLAADVTAALPAIAHVHLKDVATAGPDYVFTALGDGDVGYGRLWPLLQTLPSHVPFALELPLRLDRPGRADPVRRARALPIDAIRAALALSLARVAAWNDAADG